MPELLRMEIPDNDGERASGSKSPSENVLNNTVDMIACYSAMMSHLRYSPEFDDAPLLNMMENLNQLLISEADKLQRCLATRKRLRGWN